MPEMILNRVDLPAPFGPTIATIFPSETASETPLRALMLPYAALTPSTCSMMRHPLAPEISFDDLRRVHDLLRTAGGDDLAVIQHQKGVAEAQHSVHRMLD